VTDRVVHSLLSFSVQVATIYSIDGLTCIYQNDIEGIDEQNDTAVLVHCPYCHTTHTAERIEWCKNRYRQ
jgi:hypothetical protein